jgi:hypothetical protein
MLPTPVTLVRLGGIVGIIKQRKPVHLHQSYQRKSGRNPSSAGIPHGKLDTKPKNPSKKKNNHSMRIHKTAW